MTFCHQANTVNNELRPKGSERGDVTRILAGLTLTWALADATVTTTVACLCAANTIGTHTRNCLFYGKWKRFNDS